MGNCFGIGLNTVTGSLQIDTTPENNTASSSSVQLSKATNSSLGSTSIGSISTTSSTWNNIPSSLQSTPANLHCFSYNDLKSATRGFRPDSILGEGGFGPVYKGWIDEQGMNPGRPGTGMTIAVKKLNPESMQGYKEWMAEVLFLGRLQHPNLVRLIGYCSEDEHKLLVYEFLSRGSLDNHLFRRGEPLPWSIRMKIILGAARGLAFLHNASVIYRDLKCSNILLDAECNAKLSDFGLAKGGPTGSMSHVSTLVMGTPGYAAPEYVSTGHLTIKSDIYSFGVVLLEILTGRRVIDRNRPNGEQNLVDWARPCLNDKKKIPQIVDSKLDGQISVKVAVKIGRLALSCLHLSSKTRPQMKDVLEALESLDTTKKTGSHPPQNTARQ